MSNGMALPDGLPCTIDDWRRLPSLSYASPRDIWSPLEPFFLQYGLTLWRKVGKTGTLLAPQSDTLRAPDGYGYRTQYNPESREFNVASSLLCPATTHDGRDVVIRLMKKGDIGQDCMDVLHRICTGHVAMQGSNHAVPVLNEISAGDCTFAIFPFLHRGFNYFENLGEVMDAVTQVIEGVAFCHRQLIAHNDLASDNILTNYAGGPSCDDGSPPYRSLFPVRYYINDFELAISFPLDSIPEQRTVVGVPTTRIGRPDDYGRELAPELRDNKPYCPFQLDIWQLGVMFNQEFGHLGNLDSSLVELFDRMRAEDPCSRPTAPETLEMIQGVRAKYMSPLLLAPTPAPRPIRPPWLPPTPPPLESTA